MPRAIRSPIDQPPATAAPGDAEVPGGLFGGRRTLPATEAVQPRGGGEFGQCLVLGGRVLPEVGVRADLAGEVGVPALAVGIDEGSEAAQIRGGEANGNLEHDGVPGLEGEVADGRLPGLEELQGEGAGGRGGEVESAAQDLVPRALDGGRSAADQTQPVTTPVGPRGPVVDHQGAWRGLPAAGALAHQPVVEQQPEAGRSDLGADAVVTVGDKSGGMAQEAPGPPVTGAEDRS